MLNWRTWEAGVDQKIAKTFGESVRLSFLKNGAVDTDRPAVDITAVLHTGGDDSKPVGMGGEFRSRLSAGQAELLLDRSTYTGSPPRQGDKVRANDRAGKPWFEVLMVSDRYSNLIVLSLGQA